jgi:type I restriction enzyme M protein
MRKLPASGSHQPQDSSIDGRVGNFFSNGLRQKVDQLMDILWAGGVNNPMDAVEQISYLLFLRLLTERDEQHAKINKKYERVFSGRWARYAWGNFVTLSGDALYNAVRDAIEKLYELPGLSPTGKLLFSRATLKIYDRPTLRAVVQAIQDLDLEPHNGGDLKGDMYEYLLSRLTLSGRNGQFRTPRHIIDMIVDLVDPKPGQRICDPACGTAGFLISAYNHILDESKGKGKQDYPGGGLAPRQWGFLQEQAITGYDNDANMVKIAILNLYLHQLEKADVGFHNPLTTPGPRSGGQYPGMMFDVILANPPFAGKVQDESILEDLNAGLNTRATELLFLKWFLDHLAPGGRAGVIVPNGVLFGSNKATRKVREILLSQFDLQAIVNLPSGVFKPYSGVGTAVLVFERPKVAPKDDFVTSSVWFYDLTADGFSLDDKRTPLDANDIPDIIAKWPKREEGPNSYRVVIEKIRANDLSLAAGRYKQVIAETVMHDSPSAILGELLGLETQIIQQGHALMALIAEKR